MRERSSVVNGDILCKEREEKTSRNEKAILYEDAVEKKRIPLRAIDFVSASEEVEKKKKIYRRTTFTSPSFLLGDRPRRRHAGKGLKETVSHCCLTSRPQAVIEKMREEKKGKEQKPVMKHREINKRNYTQRPGEMRAQVQETGELHAKGERTTRKPTCQEHVTKMIVSPTTKTNIGHILPLRLCRQRVTEGSQHAEEKSIVQRKKRGCICQ